MRVSKDRYLVEVDDQFVRPKIAGLEFIDTDYNPKALATKIGKIHTLPVALSDTFENDVKLNEGDTVVFDHHVCQKQNKYSDTLFFCDYFNIYAKIEPVKPIFIDIKELEKAFEHMKPATPDDWKKLYNQTGNKIYNFEEGSVENKLTPLEKTIFCEKIVEPDYNVGGLHVKGKVSDKCAKVFEVSKYCYDNGIRKDDIIFFTKNADYEIIVEGKEFYKMYLRNVIGIERNGQLVPYQNKLLVKNVTKLGEVGGLQRIYAPNTLQYGVVINSGNTGIEKGITITYFDVFSSPVIWKEEMYSFINEENIKYKL